MTDMPATADEPVRLLLVDDHPMMRKGVAQLLELEDDLSVVGEAGSGEEALRLAAELDPDMILLDLNMKGMNGLDTLRALREAGVDARIVVFTVSDDKGDVVNVLRAGADGYLLKDMEPERLLEHIRQAATGQMTLSPQLTQILAQALRGGRPLEEPRRADRARTADPPPDRPRLQQQDDRAKAGHHRRHGEGPCQAGAAQARHAFAGRGRGVGGGERPGVSRARA